jgi:hypothetical protein
MAGPPSNSYTPEVMAVGCPRCKAQPRQRCKGPNGNGQVNMIPAHASRLAQVGKKWDRKTGSLVDLA